MDRTTDPLDPAADPLETGPLTPQSGLDEP